MAFDLAGYVEVAERLSEFFAKYPEGRLQGGYEFVEMAGKQHVVYTARCYRHEHDITPGIGTASEEIPGRTTYTKGSEIQNAETSAWGRAIVAIGASQSKRIASADEVRNARANQQSPREEQTGTTAVRAGEPTETPTSAPEQPPARQSSGVPGPPSKNRLGKLQSEVRALNAAKMGVSDRRLARGLPPLTDKCTSEDLDNWDDFIADLKAIRPVKL